MSKLNCAYPFSSYLSPGEFAALGFMVVILFSVLYLNHTKRSLLSNTGLMTFFLGACGNIIERLRYGCIRDYLDFFGYFKFNVWDSLVTFGMILMLLSLWKKK